VTVSPALILFDIDGTLLLTGRAGLRAMEATFASIFGITDAFAGVAMGGRTDSSLVSQALVRAGLSDTPEAHAAFRDAYLPRLAQEILEPGSGYKGIMPGVRELLDAAHGHRGLHLGLLTGNYRDAAAIKLSYFSLAEYFRWGVYSDDSPDRNALVPIACRRAGQHGVPDEACSRVVVIGDTPFDVQCATAAGARSIAVATGGHTARELAEAGADEVLEDLSDTERVLNLLV
jgi:phosphoglycolate phosphatase-like HAD superfamily hydrolase